MFVVDKEGQATKNPGHPGFHGFKTPVFGTQLRCLLVGSVGGDVGAHLWLGWQGGGRC